MALYCNTDYLDNFKSIYSQLCYTYQTEENMKDEVKHCDSFRIRILTTEPHDLPNFEYNDLLS